MGQRPNSAPSNGTIGSESVDLFKVAELGRDKNRGPYFFSRIARVSMWGVWGKKSNPLIRTGR